MSRTLPERANLEFLTKQAKDLLQDAKAGDAIARERLRTWGPAGASERPKLADWSWNGPCSSRTSSGVRS